MFDKLIEKHPARRVALLLFIYEFIRRILLLLQRPLGVLLIALVVYWTFERIASIKPLSPPELALWLNALPESYKVALFTSMVTVAGFIVAFRTAMASWRQQMATQFKLDSGTKLFDKVSATVQSVIDLQIYAEMIIAIATRHEEGVTDAEMEISVQKALEDSKRLDDLRNAFISNFGGFLQVYAEVFTLMTSNPNLTGPLDRIRDAFLSLSRAVYVDMPHVEITDPRRVERFFAQLQAENFRILRKSCVDVRNVASSLSGGIHGFLLSAIVPSTLYQIVYFARRRKDFESALNGIRDGLNGSGDHSNS